MAFLNPALLGLLALMGVPLLIHLIRSRKLKVVQWAAMEFLRQSQKKQKRRLRIEELILLSLRLIIVAVAVLAFCRPVLRAGIPLLSQNARVYAIVVIDSSYSMGHVALNSSDTRSSFDRSIRAANQLLTRVLKDGDSVSVILASDKPVPLIGVPSYDLKTAGRKILALKPGDRPSDNLATAQQALRLAKGSRSTIKEVYWFTDDQANAWDSSKTDAAHAVWKELGQQARVTWVSTGSPAAERDNLAIESPTLSRELVTPRLPARIEARIFNYGAHPKDDVLVNLTLDGKAAGSTRVALPPGGSATARFLPLLPHAGTYTGAVSIADKNIDGLVKDNSAPFAIRCRNSIKILLHDVLPTSDPSKSESFYLLNAMAPGGTEESLAPTLREGPGLGGISLRDFDSVVITGFTSLNSADRSVLTEYVKSGGGLLLFPGPDTDASRANEDFRSAGLLPALLGQRKTLSDEQSISINPGSIQHQALTLFKDTSAIDISSARFNTYYPLEPISDDSDVSAVKVMARFSNGDPALVERKVGLGHVILAASSAGAVWNQMALKPSYVPFVYQLLSYLGQGAVAHRNLKQDEPLFLALPLTDANRTVRVTDPDGKQANLTSVLDARGVTFSYDSTSKAGIYQVSVAGSATKDAFAVALNTAESNLAPSDPAQSSSLAGIATGRMTIAKSPDHLIETVNRSRYGVEIWRTFVWALFPLMLIESLLAQLFGRRG